MYNDWHGHGGEDILWQTCTISSHIPTAVRGALAKIRLRGEKTSYPMRIPRFGAHE